ncbi:sperm acrosome membrane-associated protein 1 [Columba livia]|uniref:sperm acrosome membrane-associated protein 1 n=1 Tax=Columba livia TaxID=8932 RepID=UPI0031BA83A1
MAGCLGLLLALLLSLLPALAAECNLTDSGEQAVGALEESTGALQGSAEPLEGNADLGLNATEVEFGVCSVTCGIGIREVLLTSGCPGTEEKCIVRVEECQGPVDCGWGIPIPEDPTCVKMPCISIPPENQFTYTWKMLIANKTSHLLLNDSAVLKVCRDTHSLIFQCETQKNGNTIASVKYRVYAATGMQTIKPKTIEMNPSSKTMLDAILVFCVITGFIVIALEIFAMIFIVVFWGVLKSVWQLKSEQDKKLANKK